MGVMNRRKAVVVRVVTGVRIGAVLAAAAAAALTLVAPAAAQNDQMPLPPAQIIVSGEGSVSAPPDYARLRGGVRTRGKTAREAAEANTKVMNAIMAALTGAGVERKDIQTAQFSVQPVYAPQEAGAEPRLTGFSVSNQVTVTARQIAKAGEILDRLVESGANEVGAVEFLHTDPSKTLDRAREAAIADARRKAEIYALAAGVKLGAVSAIAEETGNRPPVPMIALRATAMPSAVPISPGEDILSVQVMVTFDIAH